MSRRKHYRLRCDDCAWQGWAEDEFAASAVEQHEQDKPGHHAEAVESSPPVKRRRSRQSRPASGPATLAEMFDLRKKP